MTVQAIDAPGETLEGLHARDAIATEVCAVGARFRVAVTELAARVALTVAV
jgi:hypothetical protein